MKFGDNLKQIRKTKKISQEDLADKLGVSRQSVSKWETGENYPSMQNIMCLCTIFKCKINELVHEDFEDISFLDEEIKMSVVKFKENEQKKMKGISKFIYVLARISKIMAGVGVGTLIVVAAIMTYVLANTSVNTKANNAVICGEKMTYTLTNEKLEFISKDNEKYKIDINGSMEKETVEKVLDSSKTFKITLFLFIAASMIFALICVCKLMQYLEKLFINIHDDDTPFSSDNVFIIKKLALYIFLYIFSQDILGGIAQGIYNLNFNIEVELSNYLIVLIVFALSYIFKYGYEIQLDSKAKMYGSEK